MRIQGAVARSSGRPPWSARIGGEARAGPVGPRPGPLESCPLRPSMHDGAHQGTAAVKGFIPSSWPPALRRPAQGAAAARRLTSGKRLTTRLVNPSALRLSHGPLATLSLPPRGPVAILAQNLQRCMSSPANSPGDPSGDPPGNHDAGPAPP
ncbi:hypothetical protein FM103_03480 [Corynebacterium xerosis]|nr:hypothetical protein FM103_03480 [Corynebacterium xerosis]